MLVVCRYFLLVIPQGESGMMDQGFNMPVDIIISFYKWTASFLLLMCRIEKSWSDRHLGKGIRSFQMGIGQDIKYLLLIHMHMTRAEAFSFLWVKCTVPHCAASFWIWVTPLSKSRSLLRIQIHIIVYFVWTEDTTTLIPVSWTASKQFPPLRTPRLWSCHSKKTLHNPCLMKNGSISNCYTGVFFEHGALAAYYTPPDLVWHVSWCVKFTTMETALKLSDSFHYVKIWYS